MGNLRQTSGINQISYRQRVFFLIPFRGSWHYAMGHTQNLETETNMQKIFGITRKKVAGISALSLAAGVLIAGSFATTASAAPSTSSPVKLVVQYEIGSQGSLIWPAVATAFTKKYPNVTIEFAPITNAAKGGTNLQTLIADGAPDIGLIPLNSAPYTAMVTNKQLVDLSSIYEGSSKLAARVGPPAISFKQTDGNYYAVPQAVQYYNILWTNPELIKKSRAFMPRDRKFKSIDSLVDVSKKCQKAGYEGLAIGGNSTFAVSWMLDAMLPTAVTSQELDNMFKNFRSTTPLTANYNAGGFVKTLAALKSIGDANIYQKGFLGQTPAQAQSLFAAGKSCMLLGISSDVGNFMKREQEAGTMNFTPNFAVLPGVTSGSSATLSPYYGNAYGVPLKSKNQEWAIELLKYFSSDEGLTIGTIKAGGGTPISTTIKKANLDLLPPLVKSVMDFVKKNPVKSGWTSEVPGAASQAVLNPLIQQMLGGSLTPAQVGQKVQDKILDVRKNGL